MFRVWYNEGLNTVYDAIRLGRRGDAAGELHFLASHSRADSAALVAAHESFLEPKGLSEDEYVEWCLRVCCERRVDLFVPGCRRGAIARHAAAFHAGGTRLRVVASAEVIELLDDKHSTALDLLGLGIPMPEHRVFQNVAEFLDGYAALRPYHEQLCVKPTRGVFGSGFFRLQEHADPLALLLSLDHDRISVADFQRALTAAAEPPLMMLMEFLPGTERSADVLAHEGEVLAAVSRVKRGTSQQLETDGPSIELAHRLAKRYGFSGIFNLQTKDRANGTTCFLEVNTRMSGGAAYTEASGLLLPYWSVALALGLREPGEIPIAAPCAVAPVTACVRVGP